MKKRASLALAVKGALLCTLIGTAFAAEPSDLKTSEKQNVIIMFIDDLGYGDTGPYGCTDIPTPNIDRLAKEGTKCTTHYVTNAPCSPSRSSLMMGCYGQRFGKYGMARGQPIPEDIPTFARFMRDSGFVTGQIGKWDLGTKQQGPLTVGFDEVRKVPPKKQYTKQEIAEMEKRDGGQEEARHIEKWGNSKYWIINQNHEPEWEMVYDGDSMVDFVTRHKNEPFFLYFSPNSIHSPCTEAPPELTGRTNIKEGARKYLAGAIVSVDDQVGKMLAVLEKYNLRKNTLIIFSSDNGANAEDGGSSTPYRGGKNDGTQQEGWVRVPAIYSLPGVIPEGKTYDGITCTLDFYATAAALNGLPAPKHLDGVNLIPYLQGKQNGDAHEFLFWLNNDPQDEKRRHLVAVRWKNWRLYRYEESDPWQLFDLVADPQEEKNVVAQHSDVVKVMDTEFHKWKSTLPPNQPLAKNSRSGGGGPVIPEGYGWAYASDKNKTH
jgi:arylsulfatase A-like enzyme